MEEKFNCLENGDLSALFEIPQSAKSKLRSWTPIHYASAFRSLTGITHCLRSLKSSEVLQNTENKTIRPCDLLPTPELSLFNLYTWGVGSDYQLGYAKDKQLHPKKIEMLTPRHPAQSILSIASYRFHTLIINEEKDLWAFGTGRRGVLGNGSELCQIYPIKIGSFKVLQIAVGEMHSACIMEDHNVFVWGDNTYGQIPECKESWVSVPTYVKYFKSIYVEKIVAGKNHTCVLSSQSKLYLWGDDSSEQLFQKSDTIVQISGTDLAHNPDPILDISAYDTYTIVLLTSGLVIKSNPKFIQRFHVPCNCKVVSIASSYKSIHALSALNIVYSFDFSFLNKNTHFKMQYSLENVHSIHTGYIATAVDFDMNLWLLGEKIELCKELSCVKSACVTQYYNLGIVGVEKVAFEKNRDLTNLFDLAQEKVMESVNINNACELLAFSDMFLCERLRKYCEYFIARNLKGYMNVANWEYLCILNNEMSEGVQSHVAFGRLPALPEENKTQIKSLGKGKKKNRAYSGNEELQKNLNFTKNSNRERAQTESKIVMPKQYIPPPKSKNQPWGETEKATKPSFNDLQQTEAKNPLKINRWAATESKNSHDFSSLQAEEKEFNELDDALIQFALMESLSH